jgi:lysozyme family protein
MINSNARKVAERVQGILNSNGQNLKVDGRIGAQTLNAIHNTDKEWLIDQILMDRLQRYRFTIEREPQKIIYVAGWINRLNDLAEAVHSRIRFKESDLNL